MVHSSQFPKVRRDKSRGYIYFVQAADNGPVKIGWSASHPRRRLAQLQVASPYPLILRAMIRGSKEEEAEWHKRCAQYRLHGEWFEPCSEMPQVMCEGEITLPLPGKVEQKPQPLMEWALGTLQERSAKAQILREI